MKSISIIISTFLLVFSQVISAVEPTYVAPIVTSSELLSFVDMHTYKLILSDLTHQIIIDLKKLPDWPGPAPEHTLLLPDKKHVLVTYMASKTEPVGIAVIQINSLNFSTGTADVKVIKNLELDKAGSKSHYPVVTQTSPLQYINKDIPNDWSRPEYTQIHAPTLLPHSHFGYYTVWTDDRIIIVDLEKFTLLQPERFGISSQQLHGVYFNPSGTLGLGVGYFYDKSNLPVFKPNSITGKLTKINELHLGTWKKYAAFIHNVWWLDDRYAIAGSMQFGRTSLTVTDANVVGPSIWLVDTKMMSTKQIIGTAKTVTDPGILRSASWVNVIGNILFIGEEDSIDSTYANDGFVSIFDITNRESPKFIKRLVPGKELPKDFSVAHSFTTSTDGKYIIVESYTSGYILKINTENYVVTELASPKNGYIMPHGAWIAGRKD